MVKSPKADSSATATEVTFRSAWRSYCRAPKSGYSDLPVIRRALMNATVRFRLRHVRHVTFEQLSSAGYDVWAYDDGVAPLEPEKLALRDLPENWKIPQPVIVPKMATLRGAVLLRNGMAVLPEGLCCFFDTRFGDWIESRPKRFRSPMPWLLYCDPFGSALVRRHMPCIEVPGRCFSTCSMNSGNFAHFVFCV